MWGYNGQQKLLDKYNFPADKPNSFADLEPLLAKVKQGESGITPWNTDKTGNGRLFYPEIFGWDPIATPYGLAVRYDDDDLKVFNMYDTPEYEAACVLSRRWNKSGYSVANPPSNTDASAQYNAGKIAFGSGQQTPTNPQFTSFKTNGKCFVTPLLLNTDGVAATLVGVNAKTPEPEKAVQYLEAINTDDELYNLMCFGIEGKHYDFTDKALKVVGYPTGVTATSDRWNPNTDWAFGNQLNSFYRTEADAKAKRWEVEGALNKSATPSKAIGFSFDVAALQTAAATVSAAILELEPQASIGLVDAPKGRDQLLKKMQASGSDKLLAAAQQQIDDWKASK
jgi:putative aldouronate transport system substrate-binding protein